MMLVPISKPLQRALEALSNETGEPIPQLVADALSHSLGISVHTLFQVSTSGALVQGVYERAVSSTFLLKYGDFGLGTFDNLDGEMVVLDGGIYQVRSDGTVNKIVDEVNKGQGTVGKLLKDPALYDNANKLVTNGNQLVGDINAGKGTLGKLAKDEALAAVVRALKAEGLI